MPNRRAEKYLAMARDAERAADESQTAIVKHIWRSIAGQYRELAIENLRTIRARRNKTSA